MCTAPARAPSCPTRARVRARVRAQEQVAKLRGEREALAADVAVLRTDLDTTRQVIIVLSLNICFPLIHWSS